MKLSIIIPVYYNEKNLYPLYQDIKDKFIDIVDFDYEIIMVDDGSKDKSWNIMKELAKTNNKIKIFHLSRNFGSYAASLCGLSNCTGDCAIVKAADLQEPTEMITLMVDRWREGNNVVLAVRTDREESGAQKAFANLYYYLTRKFALPNMPKGGFDTFLLDKQVIKLLCDFDEKDSALTGQILWSGYKTAIVPYVRKAREIGKSRWTFKKKIKLVMDTFYGFSSMPISIAIGTGIFSTLGAMIWAIIVVFGKLSGNINVTGWTSLLIFQMFSFGIIMLTLGVLGGYLWRIFNTTRKRPVYIVENLRDHVDKKEKETL